jgi:hypothetical protein
MCIIVYIEVIWTGLFAIIYNICYALKLVFTFKCNIRFIESPEGIQMQVETRGGRL